MAICQEKKNGYHEANGTLYLHGKNRNVAYTREMRVYICLGKLNDYIFSLLLFLELNVQFELN